MSAGTTLLFNVQDVSRIEIYPPIGIARVGDSGFDLVTGVTRGEPQYFFPPEVPGHDQFPPGDLVNSAFRDSSQRIKRQAVVFHVYAFNKNNEILGEVHPGSGVTITWTVHVVNSKPSFFKFRGICAILGAHPHSELNLIQESIGRHLQSYETPMCSLTLIVDPGQLSITVEATGKMKNSWFPITGSFYGSQATPTLVSLGQISTDDKGRLIFVAGAGYSRCVSEPKQPHFQPDIISEFDSIDWVDDVCDGWVNAAVTYTSMTRTGVKMVSVQARKATVMSAPPKFAWGVHAPTTLYDIIEDIYVEAKGWKAPSTVQFYEHIWPALGGTYELSWVNQQAFQGHGPAGMGNFIPLEGDLASKDASHDKLRREVFKRLRKPQYEDPAQASTMYMPRLSGDDGDAIEPGQVIPSTGVPIKRFSALTGLQYSRFEKWAAGTFSADPPRWKDYESIEKVPLQLQPLALTLAALEHSTGDPLYPGLETYWIAKDPAIYLSDALFSQSTDIPPFRIDHAKIKPGDLSRGLSLPWQSDFSLCETHWWPSGRPDDVINILDWQRVLGHGTSVSMRDFVDKVSPLRKKWARGLRETPDYPQDYYPGSTDMVHQWQNLGFIKQKDYKVTDGTTSLAVWLEKERCRIQERTEGTTRLASGFDDDD
ncbi:hypothetical protein IEO21_09749 [Rhodonia placenta]|uniref:Uncharacterized protein n=1 Tax=Rhodonia placenta TaxID=104341 RepID=A0A8H7NTR1_9APHY|nr:hypothetical protein IEO21_09749 [Postia placenta]